MQCNYLKDRMTNPRLHMKVQVCVEAEFLSESYEKIYDIRFLNQKQKNPKFIE